MNDLRGVLRGRCTANCFCDGYDGGTEKKKCLKCGHPPGKHENISALAPTPPVQPIVGGHTDMAAHGHHGYMQHPQLPQCPAKGCTNQVWYEPGLQEDLQVFDYCSPECRDRHLLPISTQTLAEDLITMKQELHKLAASEVSPKPKNKPKRQLSKEHSSSSLGADSPSATSAAVDPRKQTKQKTGVVMIKRTSQKPIGLILSKNPCLLDTGDISGFVIVGIVRESLSYSKVKDGDIRLLDLIGTVNDTPCSKIFSPGADIQERFEQYIEGKDSIKLLLNHLSGLPSVSDSLKCAKKKSVKYTHLVVLRYSSESEDDNYGLSLSSDIHSNSIMVKNVVKDSPADLSRLKNNDKIYMYVVVSEGEESENCVVNDNSLVVMKVDLRKAHRSKQNVILFVERQISFV